MIKKKLLFTFLMIGVTLNAQVGIKPNHLQLPVSYVFPHPSAVLDLYADNLGLLLPRVTLNNTAALTSSTTPILNPPKGLVIYNPNPTTKQGIYFWENDAIDNTQKYNKLYTFNETPKFIHLSIAKDLKILENADSGDACAFSSKATLSYGDTGNPNSYDTILTLDNGYFEEAKLKSYSFYYFDIMNGVLLPPGTYTFDMNFKLQSKTSYLTSRSEPISTSATVNNNYYDIGYFVDMELFPVEADAVNASTWYNTRSETHTLSKLNTVNNINFFKTATFTKDTFVMFSIGRMQGTSYKDAVDLLKGSNIKITKISY